MNNVEFNKRLYSTFRSSHICTSVRSVCTEFYAAAVHRELEVSNSTVVQVDVNQRNIVIAVSDAGRSMPTYV